METQNQVGSYSFIIGMVIAVVLGLAAQKLGTTADWLWLLLVVCGILVGLLNIPAENSWRFLWLVTALAVIGFAGSAQLSSWENLKLIGPYLKGMFDSVLSFIIPAGVAVALKEIMAMAKGQLARQ